jgi:hypothetical protein
MGVDSGQLREAAARALVLGVVYLAHAPIVARRASFSAAQAVASEPAALPPNPDVDIYAVLPPLTKPRRESACIRSVPDRPLPAPLWQGAHYLVTGGRAAAGAWLLFAWATCVTSTACVWRVSAFTTDRSAPWLGLPFRLERRLASPNPQGFDRAVSSGAMLPDSGEAADEPHP